MKQLLIYSLLVLGCLCANAQRGNTPRIYYNRFNHELNAIHARSMEYFRDNLTDANHKKVDGRLEAITRQLEVSQKRLVQAPSYKGDNKLQESYLVEMDSLKVLFNKDFVALQNLKRYRNESYEALLKYYTALGAAEEKLKRTENRLIEAEESFANRNSITLRRDSEDDEKYKQFVKINDHSRTITLMFFKIDGQMNSFFDTIRANPNMDFKDFGLEEKVDQMRTEAQTLLSELEELDNDKLNTALQKEMTTYLKSLEKNLKKPVGKIAGTLAKEPYYTNAHRDAKLDLNFFEENYRSSRNKFLAIRKVWLQEAFTKLWP